MHVCLTIPTLATKSGGPAAVVQNLSEQLARLDTRVTVITCKTSSQEPETLPQEARVELIRVRGNGNSPRVGDSFGKAVVKVLANNGADVVHDFGMWTPANHAVMSVCHKQKVPVVCSTSGMLAPWALRHKAWKKHLAWWLYQKRDLSRATLLAATASKEAADIRRLLPKKPVSVIANGVELPPSKDCRAGRRSEVGGRTRTVLFLGRIYPVKGLINLVEAWGRVRPVGWRCVIAGPNQAGHQAELENEIMARGLADAFSFPGMVRNHEKWALIKEADLFTLPSFTENFGMVVAEALAAGVPVITTKGAPWEELQTHKCGWWTDIGIEPLATALREATSLSDRERFEMGQRGRRLVEQKYSWSQIGRDMRAVYEWVCGVGPRPECIV